MRRHTLFGTELIQSEVVSYHAKAVIRSHHERWDGRGYPDGLAGERIPEFARIAAIADVYDALTSERPYRRAVSTASAHATIVAGSGRAFEPRLVQVFRDLIAPHPPGSEVTLHDGRQAIVVRVDPKHLERPIVRVLTAPDGRPTKPVDIDLARHPNVKLVPPTLGTQLRAA
jgi:HD-GYP domain-containing protein (c-di-GMP phosphodiesterase class II)